MRLRISASIVAGLLACAAIIAVAGPSSARSRGCGDRYRYVNTTEITWAEADAAARAMGRGAHLATASSAAEETCIEAVIPSFADAWIGATDSAVEGQWRWIDARRVFYLGTAAQPGRGLNAYTDWDDYYPQPDNWDGEGPDEDCLEVWGPHEPGLSQTWNDRNCDVRGPDRGFVVEFERSR